MQGAVRRSSTRFSQAGFSLIELMVASTMGLFIMLAILMLFTNVSRTNDEMTKANALIENGRFALQLLQDDIAHAGFWDVYIPDFDDLTLATTPTDTFSSVPQPCLAFSSWSTTDHFRRRLGIAVQTHDSVPSGCTGVVTNRKSGTDILVVRHAATCEAGTTGCEAVVSGKLYFQASRCEGEAPYKLATSGLTLTGRNCLSSNPAPKRRFISHLYYVRDYAVTVGDGIPTLVRSEFDLDSGTVKAKAAVALIEGIEGFRVQLGVDRNSDTGVDVISDSDTSKRYRATVIWADEEHLTSPINRGDGVADEFVHCSDSSGNCSVDRLVNVVAVKLHLLVRSQTVTQGYVDGKSYTLGDQTITPASTEVGYKRHVFSTVVRLNNVSGRRETP